MGRTLFSIVSILKSFIGFTRNFETVAEAKADKFLRVGQKISIDERGGAVFEVLSGAESVNGKNLIGNNSGTLKLSLVSELENPAAWGAFEDGVTDDSAVLILMNQSGFGVQLNESTYLISMPKSLDAGNDKLIMLNAASGKRFVGKGRNSVLKLDLANSFDGSFDVIGLDQREPVGGKFTVGAFSIDGDRANKKANQNNLLFRFQTGTLVTATSYEVELFSIWGKSSTGGGCYMGVDKLNFSDIVMDDIGEHGAAFKNTSGDGRMMHMNGGNVHCDNCGGLTFDYSGGSQVNGGAVTSEVSSIVGKNNSFGVKIAGMHQGRLGLCDLKNINLVNQSLDSAFYTNSDFVSFHIDVLHVEDSYNGALAHVKVGELTINKLYSRNNNANGNGNGDIVQGGTESELIIKDYNAIGHANSTGAWNILEGGFTYINPTKVEGFSKTINYPLSIQTNGVAIIENGDIAQETNAGLWLFRADVNNTGQIYFNNLRFAGGLGHGVRNQGTTGGDVFYNNVNIDNFAGSKSSDPDLIGHYSNVKGFSNSVSTLALSGAGGRVNTQNKFEGKSWFDSTANIVMYATGGSATAPWVDGVGGNIITPI